MIVYSAFVPHPPLIIPEIGKDNLKFVEKTIKSMERIGEEIYASNPETIVIISPHGPMLQEAFSINMAPEFEINFEEFGDLSTKINLPGDVGLIHHYKEILEGKMPIVLSHKNVLDHGAGVPLFYFSKGFTDKKFAVVPISYSLLDYNLHFEFGRKLQNDMLNDTKRIAVIGSGDLSHRLTEDSPAGYSHWAKKFDDTIVKIVKEKDTKALLSLDDDFIDEAGECGLRSLIILFGILNSIQYSTEVYSYEGPFGVGYLTAKFNINK